MQFEALQKAMIQAMKDHDKVRKDAISTLVSATKKIAIDAGCRDNIPDDILNKTDNGSDSLIKSFALSSGSVDSVGLITLLPILMLLI